MSQTAIVTGGGSGIGLGTTKALLSKGYKVAVWDLSCSLSHENLLYCKVDVTKTQTITQALESTLSAFGKISVLVNCAGIAIACPVILPNSVHSLEDFERVLRVNIIGLFDVCRQVARHMVDGVIINISSINAYEGTRVICAYSASKGAVNGLTLPMARDLAQYGIRVVGICPGLIETPMGMLIKEVNRNIYLKETLSKRMGKPEELAHAVIFVIENKYMNGVNFRIDSGGINPNI
jgi:3-hydroxyacyl-CoA dehydrogenase/3-hydroxy-2-methylbutyryl-CoA dehydrogenase